VRAADGAVTVMIVGAGRVVVGMIALQEISPSSDVRRLKRFWASEVPSFTGRSAPEPFTHMVGRLRKHGQESPSNLLRTCSCHFDQDMLGLLHRLR
jgi:hypothetical protein